MNNQPTEILLLFTDYLDNRDSIAFLRLSSPFWASHRSPRGSYRLKTCDRKDDQGNFHWPSALLASSLISLHSSPYSGHYYVKNLFLEDFDDFSQVFPSSPGKREEFPTIFRKVQKISIGFSPSSCPTKIARQQWQLQFSRLIAQYKVELMDFSPFHHLEELQMGTFSNVPLLSVICSPSLRTFYWGRDEILPLLPDSLEELQFSHYNLPLPDLPRGLKILKLGNTFNKPIKPNSLPTGLKILHLSNHFNQELELGCFPIGIEEITFQSRYVYLHPFRPGIFPDSLRTLILPRYCTHPIPPGVLPKSLETLDLCTGSEFSHPYPTLPTGLKFLSLENPPHQDVHTLYALRMFGMREIINELPRGYFPSSLTEIHMGGRLNTPLVEGIFPIGLKKLYLGFFYMKLLPVGIFPSSLEEIEFGARYNFPLLVGIFPEGLRKIIFSNELSYRILRGLFPPSVEEIDFRDSTVNGPLSRRVFPIGLKKIRFSKIYNQSLPVGIFPQNIHTIELGECFSHRLEAGLFPSSVRRLKISTSHPLPIGLFPDGLEEIVFGIGFQQSLLPGIFPSSLRRLKFPEGFIGDILPGVLPEFLCELDLGNFLGFFPLSALPSYFCPDFPGCPASGPLCLKVPNHFPQDYIAPAQLLISRLGENRLFLQNSLRLPLSSNEIFSFAEPIDGGESLIISHQLFHQS